MKKIVITLFAMTLSMAGFAQEEEKERNYDICISGELDLSANNHSGGLFDQEKGVKSSNSTTGFIPSFDVWGEYRFSPKWKADFEAEFISGCGVMVDEVSLTHTFHPALNVKGGMFTLPVGYGNSGRSYMDFFTNSDPEGEVMMMPCPFTEIGLALEGETDFGFNYFLSLTSALNAWNFSAQNWASAATQGFFSDEVRFSSPAITLRLGETFFEGLNVGLGVYYSSNILKNSAYYDSYKEYSMENFGSVKKTPITILFADAEYSNDYFTARIAATQGHLGNAYYLTDYLGSVQDAVADGEMDELEYAGGSIGKDIKSAMAEVGLNLKNCFYRDSKGPELMPFVHYELYDLQSKVDKEGTPYLSTGELAAKDERSKVKAWTFGCNWKCHESVLLKFNYALRNVGNGYKNLNSFNVAVAYNFDL